MKRITWVPVLASAILLIIAIPTVGAGVLGLGAEPATEASFETLVQQTESGLGIESSAPVTDLSGDDYGYGMGGACEATSVVPPF